jgi:hypothetical protein
MEERILHPAGFAHGLSEICPRVTPNYGQPAGETQVQRAGHVLTTVGDSPL